MIQLPYGVAVFLALVGFYWNESGENPALFCYRMGWVAYASARQRAAERRPS